MKIVKTTECRPGVSGNRNSFRRRLFLEDGGRIEIEFRMMSIPPFITDVRVWEYKTKTGRKHLRVTTYVEPDPENMDLHEKDAHLFNSLLLTYSEIPPGLREVAEDMKAEHMDSLVGMRAEPTPCGKCGREVFDARGDGGMVLVSSVPGENRCSECFKEDNANSIQDILQDAGKP
ncbi:MAG: hypothetical protein AB7V51_07870 [Methanoregulaceae archaeon]